MEMNNEGRVDVTCAGDIKKKMMEVNVKLNMLVISSLIIEAALFIYDICLSLSVWLFLYVIIVFQSISSLTYMSVATEVFAINFLAY